MAHRNLRGVLSHLIQRNERRNIFNDNQEIGNLFGLGYSSISRRMTIMKSKLSKEDEMNKRLIILITNQG